ncbi:tyrosine-type recombinase/integrase [Duganella sp. LjRoot269]|uniref:tyrosine-type recombinase/integrase n=1 Tax=Duganella sp. LjRoot269 TaxID=3342305 RepID=UPI003ED14201
MGRRREIFDKHDLPPRVYLHHGSYRYHPREGKRIPLGKDYGEAMRIWASIVKPVTDLGTVSALIDWYLINVAPKKAPRTYADNKKEAEYLKKGLGHIPYSQLKPHHVATYRDERGQDAPVRANREKALLSHVYTKAMEKGMVDFNPCKGVKRNAEKRRERMIEDREFQAVYACAEPSVQRMMTLIYRTCQRPEDLIKAGPASIKRIEHEGREIRVLRIQQGKTGKTVDIILAGDLEKLVDEHLSAKTVWPTFVHTRVGKKYTYSGLVAMFGRYVRKEKLTDFGMYDLKGKGATDMFRSGTPIERIQHLLGHESVTTTEIYIKARLPDVSMPNMREMAEKDSSPMPLQSAQRK